MLTDLNRGKEEVDTTLLYTDDSTYFWQLRCLEWIYGAGSINESKVIQVVNVIYLVI